MESKTAKKLFCSDKCKVYYAREKKRSIIPPISSKTTEPVSKKTEQKDTEFNFEGLDFLNIEDFTKFPKKNMPQTGWQKQDWVKKKAESDQEIRTAWANYKTTKNTSK